MPNTKELRAERARLVQQARDIQAKADAENRAMTDEECANFDRAMEDADKLLATIERAERLEEAERALNESRGAKTVEYEQRDGHEVERRVPGAPTREERTEALRAWLLKGSNQAPDERMLTAASRCRLDVANKLLAFDLATHALRSLDHEDVREWEKRALSAGTGSAGGFTVPDDTMRELEVAMLRFGGMRQVANVIRTATGAPLPWPTANDTANEGEIIGENTAVNQQDITFGQIVFDAYKYSSKMILVPVELLQDSSVNLAEFIGQALGQRIGRITNRHFTVGTGTAQPRGIVTAAVLGKTGAATTSVTYEDLVDLQHSVDPDYRTNARWMFADTTLRELKKLRDGDGRPLWSPGIAVREPDTILGHPYVVNQHMPVMAAGAKSILFGDLSKYKIRDVQQVSLLRLDERFADSHQVAFLALSRHDGDLVDAGANPVKYYQNAAA